MPCSQTLFQLLVISLFSNFSRALDPRVRHQSESYIDAQAPSLSFKREGPGAARSDTLKQQFLDLGLAGLGTNVGGVLQGVVQGANDMLGNELSPSPDDDVAATANTTSNTKYVVAQ